MFRFLWLALSLAGWGLVFYFLPRMAQVLFLLPAGVSLIGYLYGWAIHKRNWLSHFFLIGLWTGVWGSYQAMGAYIDNAHVLPFRFVPDAIAKILMVVTLLSSGLLTFVNYRISLNFHHRRGNIDRDLLGRLYGDEPWRAFKRLFKRRRGEVVLTLGDEIPFKD